MTLNDAIRQELDRLEQTKTFKKETLIESEQGAVVRVRWARADFEVTNEDLSREAASHS